MHNFLQLVCAPLRLGFLFGLYFFSMNSAHAQPQQNLPALALEGYQAFALRVSDIDRSVRFYSDVFGAAPVRETKRATYALGSNNQHFILSEAEGDEPAGFAWIGLGVRNFGKQRVTEALLQLGFSPAETQEQGPLTRAMRFWSDESWGQDALFFADAEGIVYRVMSTDDCGACAAAASAEGLLSAQGINHFTNFVASYARGNRLFFEGLGLGILAYQGPTSPTVSLGDGLQFLMYVGGTDNSSPSVPGRTDHVSLSVAEFDVEAIRARLTSYGLAPSDGQRPPRALTHWVSLRQPNRGGAVGGTPEVYFSDPDGLAIQIQDAGYCGGGGYLGDQCD
jgi:catechol 2,3-dioxygenase-like lactoylglutathione lyase family enzyme